METCVRNMQKRGGEDEKERGCRIFEREREREWLFSYSLWVK
jgi:hypothetical protein